MTLIEVSMHLNTRNPRHICELKQYTTNFTVNVSKYSFLLFLFLACNCLYALRRFMELTSEVSRLFSV